MIIEIMQATNASLCYSVTQDNQVNGANMAVAYKLRSAKGNPITLKAPNSSSAEGATIVPNIRCPHCMHLGALSSVLAHDLNIDHVETRNKAPINIGTSKIGIRVCPNRDCRGLVMVVIDRDGVICLPNEVLDFDPSDIPRPIASSLEEAVKCHSIQCYKAAALMVRRVLEELCEDRSARGSNLKERIAALSKIIVIPQDLIEAADHLRLLGNDAAHIEGKTYESIGEAEVRIAIDLTKELLKGAYQYKGLLSRLTSLQKPTS
jgi:Domain of unknown function (DUF4145)